MAAAPVPKGETDATKLAAFYYRRGSAARALGQLTPAIRDLELALPLSRQSGGALDYKILTNLAWLEQTGGRWSRAIQHYQAAIAAVPSSDRRWLFSVYRTYIHLLTRAGQLGTAERSLASLEALARDSRQWPDVSSEARAQWAAYVMSAEASILDARGDFSKAEASYRQALDSLRDSDRDGQQSVVPVQLRARLGRNLAAQGRAAEAEEATRTALEAIVRLNGRNSRLTAEILGFLGERFFEQGAYADAEAAARDSIEIYLRLGAAAESELLNAQRTRLGSALAAEGRWSEALGEFSSVRQQGFGPSSFHQRLAWAWTLIQTDQPDAALERLTYALDRFQASVGNDHWRVALVRGLRAMSYRAKGNQTQALLEFRDAARVLVARVQDAPDGEGMGGPAEGGLRSAILTAYVELLFELGVTSQRDTGVAATAEAFRIAEVVRSQGVQRAVDASAARAAAANPALSRAIREEQDLRWRIGAHEQALSSQLSLPVGQQDEGAVPALRGRLAELRLARQELDSRVTREFPAYATLVNPPAPTVEDIRGALQPSETLLSLFVTERRTYIWAIPHTGQISANSIALAEPALAALVARVRSAVTPTGGTVGDIPEFDLDAALTLHDLVLAPTRSTWQSSRRLLIVSNGPLAQLPFGVLPVSPHPVGHKRGPLFAQYRDVPWLIRSHAIAVLPTATSLLTLRQLPAGPPTRRPFVGFGDPVFSLAHVNEPTPAPGTFQSLESDLVRRAPIGLRALTATSKSPAAATDLADLPRLPDTAQEILGIARVTGADPTRDVFLGIGASEAEVKRTNLAQYRVVAFATHGLGPGDLTGLKEPALALSTPAAAGGDGDGLLTMTEILGLRLDADWVVLSACNTASGQAYGSESLSGLGRAFFYAGARALLVSNWPIETTSAHAFTTHLFARLQNAAPPARAEALQQTMQWLLDDGVLVNLSSGRVLFSYAHPIFWAPFSLVGDGGR